MTTMTPFSVPTEEAREHTELSPEFSDGPDLAEETDPSAPWGRKADGTPKAKPGRPAGTPDRQPRTRTTQRRARVAAAPPRKSRSTSKPKQPAMPDYRPGIVGILQLVAAPLAVAGIKNPAFAADAAAITMHAEPLAEAMQETAEQVPQFAAVLDKVLTVGPYGALLAAAMPLVVQVAANHNLVPAQIAQTMGAMPPAQLLASLVESAAE